MWLESVTCRARLSLPLDFPQLLFDCPSPEQMRKRSRVWLHLDEDPGPVFAYYEDAPLVLSLAPPEPVTPTPRGLEDATATDATGTDIDPEPEIEPEPETAPETETETKPETETEPETESDGETETAETESESDGEPEPDTETESPAPAGTPDPSGSPLITERTEPTRRTGTSPELAPGEMATCLVRAEGKGWHVQGCATGLHRDAISLAREVRSAQLVLVTLKGA